MTVRVEHGDCLKVMERLQTDGVQFDSCVTDPPYHLVSIVKRFGKESSAPAQFGKDGAYARASRGFMGKQWDGGNVAFDPATWALVYGLLKPGAHLIAFSGTRTYHRMACAIEDAGFEIRDQIGWLYGSGFPKSHNLHDEWEGWGTALKPAWEPMCLARKPICGTIAANMNDHGTGAIHIEPCRMETDENLNGGTYSAGGKSGPMPGDERTGAALGLYAPGARPAHDYVQPAGRWPANVIHDGSDEVLAAFPDAPGQQRVLHGGENSTANVYGKFGPKLAAAPRGDEGSAARFFYSAKATAEDRLESKHPTVKPVDLMRYLVRLVTQPKGLVLDPFAGSGTTGMACMAEGFNAVLIEREDEYVADIKRRLAHVRGEDAPLFAGVGA